MHQPTRYDFLPCEKVTIHEFICLLLLPLDITFHVFCEIGVFICFPREKFLHFLAIGHSILKKNCIFTFKYNSSSLISLYNGLALILFYFFQNIQYGSHIFIFNFDFGNDAVDTWQLNMHWLYFSF